jgi:hypothetical protein
MRVFRRIQPGIQVAGSQVSVSAANLYINSSQWIIGRRDDLLFFVGSASLGYLLMAIAFAQGGLPGKIVAALGFALDGPHVYSTATRAVLDPAERKRQGLLWLALFPLCLIGPIVTYKFGFSVFFLGIAALCRALMSGSPSVVKASQTFSRNTASAAPEKTTIHVRETSVSVWEWKDS